MCVCVCVYYVYNSNNYITEIINNNYETLNVNNKHSLQFSTTFTENIMQLLHLGFKIYMRYKHMTLSKI